LVTGEYWHAEVDVAGAERYVWSGVYAVQELLAVHTRSVVGVGDTRSYGVGTPHVVQLAHAYDELVAVRV
jgi:hypothetical protein